jgi:signal transduction histidine kinase
MVASPSAIAVVSTVLALTLVAVGVALWVVNRMRAHRQRLEKSLADVRALAARSHRVREDERASIAREIHDELGQVLTSIKIDLSFLRAELPAGAMAQGRLASLVQLTDEALRSVRRISTSLRPGLLDDLGVVAAIEWASEDFAARTGIECHVTVPDDPPALDADRATAFFRIFQEALTNITRHAFATRVDVRIAREDDALLLEIRDNGVGIDASSPPDERSFGILGMRERAQLFGGSFAIRGGADAGTIVTVRIPATETVGEPG